MNAASDNTCFTFQFLSATGVSTTNSIIVSYSTSAVSGNITVKGTSTCGDGTSETLAVAVNPLPASASTIIGPASVCQGQDSVNYLVPIIANAVSYIWTLPSGANGISNTTSILVNFDTSAIPGMITVHGTNGCGDGEPDSIFVQVNPKPPTPVIVHTQFYLISSAQNGNLWHNHQGPIAGAVSQQYLITQNGHFYTIVTLAGCSSDTSNIISITTGIEKPETDDQVLIYPNPFADALIIDALNPDAYIQFQILNSLGQIVRKGEFNGKHQISTSSWVSGVYIIQLTNDQTIWHRKVIKQ